MRCLLFRKYHFFQIARISTILKIWWYDFNMTCIIGWAVWITSIRWFVCFLSQTRPVWVCFFVWIWLYNSPILCTRNYQLSALNCLSTLWETHLKHNFAVYLFIFHKISRRYERAPLPPIWKCHAPADMKGPRGPPYEKALRPPICNCQSSDLHNNRKRHEKRKRTKRQRKRHVRRNRFRCFLHIFFGLSCLKHQVMQHSDK